MKDREHLFVKEKDFVTRCIGEQTVIVPLRDGVGDLGSIYTLNDTGTSIWRLIDGTTSLQKIVDTICREYEVTEKEAEQDVTEFLSLLKAAGIIRAAQPGIE
jgi:hypothetical protein